MLLHVYGMKKILNGDLKTLEPIRPFRRTYSPQYVSRDHPFISLLYLNLIVSSIYHVVRRITNEISVLQILFEVPSNKTLRFIQVIRDPRFESLCGELDLEG